MKRTITNTALKETITFIKTAEETNGEISELEISLKPGGGNPLHYHLSYTEKFTALEGELGMELKGGQKIFLNPGESYLVKIKEVHRFFNPGNTDIKFRNEIRPGHTGFENTLRILSGLSADGLYNDKGMPKNFVHLAICGIMSDMRLPGLMTVVNLVVKFVATRTKSKETAQQLVEKYCR